MDKATPTSLKEILEKLQPKKLTPEEQKKLEEKRKQYHNAVNSLFTTDYGRIVIKNMLGYVKYWDSVFKYKDDDRLVVQAQRELVRELFLRELSAENLAQLIDETRNVK